MLYFTLLTIFVILQGANNEIKGLIMKNKLQGAINEISLYASWGNNYPKHYYLKFIIPNNHK